MDPTLAIDPTLANLNQELPGFGGRERRSLARQHLTALPPTVQLGGKLPRPSRTLTPPSNKTRTTACSTSRATAERLSTPATPQRRDTPSRPRIPLARNQSPQLRPGGAGPLTASPPTAKLGGNLPVASPTLTPRSKQTRTTACNTSRATAERLSTPATLSINILRRLSFYLG